MRTRGSIFKFFKSQHSESDAGFTLIEILLVLALIVLVVGVTLPLAWGFLQSSDLDISTLTAVQSLRRAQQLAAEGAADSSWGVELEQQTVTVFSGSSFASRDSNLDEQFNLPESLNYSGPQ